MLLTLTRLITATLLIASAAAFATGAAIEHHTTTSERHIERHAETGATSDHASGAEGAAHGESSSGNAERTSETLLGINPEATWLVVSAVAVSLLLAALILSVGSPLLAGIVALTMLAFTTLDIREVAHQLSEARLGLAALAATVAALHLLAGTTALITTRGTRAQAGARIALYGLAKFWARDLFGY